MRNLLPVSRIYYAVVISEMAFVWSIVYSLFPLCPRWNRICEFIGAINVRNQNIEMGKI